MDEIILGRLSASVIRYIGEVLAEPHDGSYKMTENASLHVHVRPSPPGPPATPVNRAPSVASVGSVASAPSAKSASSAAASGAGVGESDADSCGLSNSPTAIDELMETLTGDVVGYISYRLNTTIDREPPRIIDVDVIQNLARDVIIRTSADVARADKGRQFADKCIEAYVFVGEIEAWLKRNVTAKNKDVLTSIANLKAILQAD